MFDAGRKNFGFSMGENRDLGPNCASGIDEKILDFLLEGTGILKSLIQDRSRKNNFLFDAYRKNFEFSSVENMVFGQNCASEIDGKILDFLLEATGILKSSIRHLSRKNNFPPSEQAFYSDRLPCDNSNSISPPPGYTPRYYQLSQHPQPTHILELLHQIRTTQTRRTRNPLKHRRTSSLVAQGSMRLVEPANWNFTRPTICNTSDADNGNSYLQPFIDDFNSEKIQPLSLTCGRLNVQTAAMPPTQRNIHQEIQLNFNPSTHDGEKNQRLCAPQEASTNTYVMKTSTTKDSIQLRHPHERGSSRLLRKGLSVGLWNMGPLNNAKVAAATEIMRKHDIQLLCLSEGSSLSPLNGMITGDGRNKCIIHNTIGRYGGAATLCRTSIDHRWRLLHQDEELSLTQIVIKSNPVDLRIYIVYVSPRDNRSSRVLDRLFNMLDGEFQNRPGVILGDFNAPHGSSRRALLEQWTQARDLTIEPTAPTHYRNHCEPTQLDLVIHNGTVNFNIEIIDEGFEHRLLCFHLATTAERQTQQSFVKWMKLRNPANQWALIKRLNEAMDLQNQARLEVEQQEDDPSLITSSSVLSTLSSVGENLLGVGPRRRKNQLQSIYERCRKLSACELTEAERLNKNDLEGIWKNRIANSSYSNFWKLFRDRKQTAVMAEEIRDKIGSLYKQENYPDHANHTQTAMRIQQSSSIRSALDQEFTAAEIRNALLSSGKGKAPGLDGISHIALRTAAESPKFVAHLCSHYNSVLRYQTGRSVSPASHDHSTSSIQLGFKQFDSILHAIPKNDGGHRIIFIQDKIVSMLELICWNRIKREAPDLLLFGNQYGFTPGLSTTDHLFQTVSLLTAPPNVECERKKPLLCLLDIKKAFDSVPRSVVCTLMADRVGSRMGRFFALIAKMTLTKRNATIAPSSSGVCIEVEKGVPQGSVLSPWLFACVMDSIQKQTNLPPVRHLSQGAIHLYADDITMVSFDADQLQKQIDRISEALQWWGGELNAEKSVLIDHNRSKTRLMIDATTIPTKTQGRCLGRLLDIRGRSSRRQIDLGKIAGRLSSLVWKGLPPLFGMMYVRSCVWSKLLYGSEVFPPHRDILKPHFQLVKLSLGIIAKRTHRCVLQREVGLLFHPIVWIHTRIINWMQKLNPQARKKLYEMFSWWKDAWPYLAETRTPEQILRRPELRLPTIANNLKEELMREAQRLTILDESDPAWDVALEPKAYLRHKYSNFAVLFRSPSMNTPDMGKILCPFCMAGEDSGLHYSRSCTKLPDSLLSARNFLISECGGWRNLRLSNNSWVRDNGNKVDRIIEWMRNVYTARAQHTSTLHNRRLFHDVALLRPPPPQGETSRGFVCSGCAKHFKKGGYLRLHLQLSKKCPEGVFLKNS